jgi:hypothetical protein
VCEEDVEDRVIKHGTHSGVRSCTQNTVSTYCVLGPGDTAFNQWLRVPVLMDVTFSKGRKTIHK